MFKLFKIIHFLGLTLFLGSIWVFIVQGTPTDLMANTIYERTTLVMLIKTLTLPGLIAMMLSGIGMVVTRSALLKSRFFKVKMITAFIIFINANFILHVAKKAAVVVQSLPDSMPVLQHLVMQESVMGAVNVLLALFLISYSVISRKYAKI